MHNSTSDCSSFSTDDHANCYAHNIIIGLGTAGALLLRSLVDSGQSVIGFEMGVNHTGDPVVEKGITNYPPTGNFSTVSFDSKYAVSKLVPDSLNASRLGLLFLAEQYTSGIGGGGSSSHNYMLAVRGSQPFWDQVGIDSGLPRLWSYFPNLDRIKSIEHFTGVSQLPEERGEKGKINVVQVDGPLSSSPQLAIATGLSAVTGAPILDDYNVSNATTAIASTQYTVYPTTLLRNYAINGYLPPDIMKFNGDSTNIKKRPFKVFFETHVNRILFDGKKAIGIEYQDKNGNIGRAIAKNRVILCAGSPFSAQLLQLSGIGDENLLKHLRIEKVLNSPNVGLGLQAQYGVSVAISGLLPGNGFQAFTGGLPYYNDSGRKFQWIAAPFSGFDVQVAAYISYQGPYFGSIIWNMKPRSKGSALIVENSPFILPNILLNLYSDGDNNDPMSDLSASIAAYKLGRDWAHKIGQTILWPPESHFIPGDDSKLATDALSQAASDTSSHYVNTCGMGVSGSGAVVSGKLKVHGLKHLYVADNSVFATIPDANTCLPAYTVGAVAAHLFGAKVPQD